MSNTLTQDRILKLLGSGLSNEVVATTVGCDPSYVTQMLSDDHFREQVTILRTETLTKNTKRDQVIDDLEDTILDKLQKSIEYVINPQQLLGAFRTVNQAKRRGAPPQQSVLINNTVVNLQLPPVIHRTFSMNAENAVVEVEGRPMVTMQARQLLATLAQQRESDGSKYAEIAKRIPLFDTVQRDQE